MYMDDKNLKFRRPVKRIYEMCLGITDDKKNQLLKIQLINTVDETKHSLPNISKQKLREQDNYLIRLDAGQLTISKRQLK